MSTITLKQVPEELHQAMKIAAEKNGRSLNREIIRRLEQTIQGDGMNPAERIKEAAAVRERLGIYLTQRELDQEKSRGRS